MQASQAEKNTFGEDVKLHPVTKRPLEQGHGALSHEKQALFHLRDIEAESGEQIEMRKALGIPTSEEIAAKAREAAEKAAEEKKKLEDVGALHARIAELENQIADLTKEKSNG